MAEPLAEKVVKPAINPSLVAYCPTMDLIALSTVDEHTQVYRLNGQKVFSVQSKLSSTKVAQIKWKPNGQSLATAYSNGSLFLTNAHTGKAVHQIDCSKYSKSPLCCLGWGINFTDSNKVSMQVNKLKNELTLDDIISQNPQTKAVDAVPDLPLDLAFLDVEVSLPKLSTLSSSGIEDDIFSSRTSLDTLLQPLTAGSTDSADVLVVGFEDGTVHLSIYDFFEIGSFSLSQTLRDFQSCKPLLHNSHPYSTTHSLLVSCTTDGEEALQFVPLDLRLISTAGRYLSLLASKSTQLHNVLRYIRQVQRQMCNDFKASQDLPSRFMANIEETLEGSSDYKWTQAAYHLVVTGDCHPEVKDWLVDQLGERGHKRWEKATTTGYESVRRLAHESLLPALERFTVIVSRLRGLSKFQPSNVTLGLSTPELDNIIDTVNCLQFVAHQILIVSGSELRQYIAFSTWLRQEIENQASDPSFPEAADEETNIDHANTLLYIEGAMMFSKLKTFFDLEPQTDPSPQWDLTAEGRSLFELYRRELKIASGQDPFAKRLPKLDALINHLDIQCTAVFGSIAETQRRNVRFGTPISLGAGIPTFMDTRMMNEDSRDKNTYVTYVIVGPRSKQPGVCIYRIVLQVENGMSSTGNVEIAFIRTTGWNIRDAKFVDDEDLVLAVSDNASSRLLRFPYRRTPAGSIGMNYITKTDQDRKQTKDQTGRTNLIASVDFANPEHLSTYTWHEFPMGVSWTPQRIEVNGRKGRRAICVIAEDGFHYRVYDLDSPQGMDENEDSKTQGSDEVMS